MLGLASLRGFPGNTAGITYPHLLASGNGEGSGLFDFMDGMPTGLSRSEAAPEPDSLPLTGHPRNSGLPVVCSACAMTLTTVTAGRRLSRRSQLIDGETPILNYTIGTRANSFTNTAAQDEGVNCPPYVYSLAARLRRAIDRQTALPNQARPSRGFN